MGKLFFFSLALLFCLISGNAVAEEVSATVEESEASILFRGGLSLGAHEELTVIAGIPIVAAVRIGDSPLSFGIKTGYFTGVDIAGAFGALFVSAFGADAKVQAANILPLLPTLELRKYSGWFHPYLGISAGPAITFARAEFLRSNRVESRTLFHMMFLARAGFDLDIVGPLGINLEPVEIGFYNGKLIYLPSANVVLSF